MEESTEVQGATLMKTVSNKQCLLCSDSNKRLFCLIKHKVVNEHFVEWIDKCFNLQLPIPIKLLLFVRNVPKCAKHTVTLNLNLVRTFRP